jgi:transposase
MVAVMIGIDPHRGRVRRQRSTPGGRAGAGSSTGRGRAAGTAAGRGWAWPERTWAVDNGGLGYLLAEQLIFAGERVVNVPPKLAARVRLLNPNDASEATVWSIVRSLMTPYL